MEWVTVIKKINFNYFWLILFLETYSTSDDFALATYSNLFLDKRRLMKMISVEKRTIGRTALWKNKLTKYKYGLPHVIEYFLNLRHTVIKCFYDVSKVELSDPVLIEQLSKSFWIFRCSSGTTSEWLSSNCVMASAVISSTLRNSSIVFRSSNRAFNYI